MISIIHLATAPICIGLFYTYIRDQYEKEPIYMLLLGLLYGVITTFVIYAFGVWLEGVLPHKETPFYTAFVSSAFVEEFVKYIFLLAFLRNNKENNEPFDCIVYAVFLSLGFAWLENIVYVNHPTLGGIGTGFLRGVVSVPSHGLFGVWMGYHLGQAKFFHKRSGYLWAFLAPYLVHGGYNYFLLAESNWFWVPFIVLEICLWKWSFVYMKRFQLASPFK